MEGLYGEVSDHFQENYRAYQENTSVKWPCLFNVTAQQLSYIKLLSFFLYLTYPTPFSFSPSTTDGFLLAFHYFVHFASYLSILCWQTSVTYIRNIKHSCLLAFFATATDYSWVQLEAAHLHKL